MASPGLEQGSPVDAVLVAAARNGDRSAFEALVRRHLKAAHAAALTRVSVAEDADDVCQEAFVTALEKLEACRRPEHFRAWLLTIVRNRAHNFRRREDLRRGVPLELARARASARSPERDVEDDELRTRMRHALGQLTETQRRVVLLHDYEGWKHKEIGEHLGTSAGASRFHLHMARRRLRELLADLDPGGDR